ncbi:endonuclease/exonuclease/phosphatase family protein [Nonomuraea africana]|uniref:endonuclease/exonuclease/phosphatase family protein n=1 Tax=Nonomuraea africana TaxID=46171 RepID=UPI003403E1A4
MRFLAAAALLAVVVLQAVPANAVDVPHFITDSFALRNARAGQPYAATVKGLVQGDVQSFAKANGPDWVTVAADGTVTGTPPASAGTTTFTVEARGATGRVATAAVTVRVRPRGAALVPELKAMSWNLWYGGTQVNEGRVKQLRFLLDSDVDVVGMQETYSTSAKELAEALGWDYYQAGYDMGIISRYPIVSRGPLPEESGLAGITARIRLDEGRDLVVWNAHLGYTPYGPYDACFGQYSVKRLLSREAQAGRTEQIEQIVAAMSGDLAEADRHPVLLTGDFNAPSHLDWTPATQRCGYDSVPWPTSVIPEQAGLKDSFRIANPDPVAAPGITWSPVYKTFTGGYGHNSHKGEPEPQDRIDFVHYKALRATASQAVVTGTPKPIPDHVDNEWTSDHAAVLTTFTVG